MTVLFDITQVATGFELNPNSWIVRHLQKCTGARKIIDHWSFNSLTSTEWDRISDWLEGADIQGDMIFTHTTEASLMNVVSYTTNRDEDNDDEEEEDWFDNNELWLDSITVIFNTYRSDLMIQNAYKDIHRVATIMKYLAMCYLRTIKVSSSLVELVYYKTVSPNRILIVGPSGIGEQDYLIKSPFVKRLPKIDYGSINQ